MKNITEEKKEDLLLWFNDLITELKTGETPGDGEEEEED